MGVGVCRGFADVNLVSSVGRYSERWRFRHNEPLSLRMLSLKAIVQHVFSESGEEAARNVEKKIRGSRRYVSMVDELESINPIAQIPLVPRVLHSLFGANFRTCVPAGWSRKEHISVLECRACVSALVLLLGKVGFRNKRLLLLSDSLACILAGSKGRSSKPGMCRALRQIAAALLATGISIHLRWIPSELNNADRPSRRGLWSIDAPPEVREQRRPRVTSRQTARDGQRSCDQEILPDSDGREWNRRHGSHATTSSIRGRGKLEAPSGASAQLASGHEDRDRRGGARPSCHARNRFEEPASAEPPRAVGLTDGARRSGAKRRGIAKVWRRGLGQAGTTMRSSLRLGCSRPPGCFEGQPRDTSGVPSSPLLSEMLGNGTLERRTFGRQLPLVHGSSSLVAQTVVDNGVADDPVPVMSPAVQRSGMVDAGLHLGIESHGETDGFGSVLGQDPTELESRQSRRDSDGRAIVDSIVARRERSPQGGRVGRSDRCPAKAIVVRSGSGDFGRRQDLGTAVSLRPETHGGAGRRLATAQGAVARATSRSKEKPGLSSVTQRRRTTARTIQSCFSPDPEARTQIRGEARLGPRAAFEAFGASMRQRLLVVTVVLELFSGSGHWTRAAAAAGEWVLSID